RPPGHDPGAPGAARRPARGQSVPAARSHAAPPAHARRPQAGAAAPEPGAIPAAGLRGSALAGYRDPGPAGEPERESADRTPASAGELPAGLPARLGEQDLLHASAAGPLAAGERRRLPAGPPGGRPESGAPHPPPDPAYRGQSLLPGGERTDAGGDRGPGGRAGSLPHGAGPPHHADAGHSAGGAGSAHRPLAPRGEGPAPD